MRILFTISLFALSLFYMPYALAADTRAVVISEIGWMGTAASTNDEWIELFNASDVDIDLTDWTLAAADGTPSIDLSGTIAAGSYFLLERTDDTTISDVAADLIYTGSLSNSGEDLILSDDASSEIDRVDVWHAGDNASKASMERARSDVAGTEATNWATNDGATVAGSDADGASLLATPAVQNSAYEAPVDVTAPAEVTDLAATVGDTEVTLGWTASASADLSSYKLYLDDSSGYDAGTDLGSVTSYTVSSLMNGTAYTFKITAIDASDNESDGAMVIATPTEPDITAPTDGDTITATAGDTEVALSWDAASDDTAVTAYFLSIDGGAATDLGNVMNYTVTGLTNDTAYSFKITAQDAAGNESTGLTMTATPQGTFTEATAGDVLINEVAWAGSSSSSSDEWIELINTTSKTFDLTNWVISGAATSGGDFTISSGELAAESYFLVSNNAQDNAFSGGESVLAVDPDFVDSSLSLSNSSFQLTLKDSAGMEIDAIGDGGSPTAGDADTPASMVRLPDGSIGTAARAANMNTGIADHGTPGAANFLDDDLSILSVSASTTVPLPDEAVSFTVSFENTGLNDAASFMVELWDGDPDSGGVKVDETAIGSLASFASGTASFDWMATAGSYAFYARVVFASDLDSSNDESTVAVTASDHLVLSEIVPDPTGTDSTEEWIEIYNPTDAAIDLMGFSIGGAALDAASIDAGEYAFMKADGASGLGWTGAWIALSNSADTVELRNAADELIDSFSYSVVVAGGSHAREDGNIMSWITLLHPTQGAANIERNDLPQPVITVQGTGNTSGSCTLYTNLTAEDSTDADGDALSYSWDFGNGETSDDENPAGFYFSAGDYTVTLTADDSLGTASTTQVFSVSSSCGGGSYTATPAVEDEPLITSIPASRVDLLITEVSANSDADWVELFVLDDGADGRGVDLGGFYFEADKNIKTIPTGTIARSGDFILLTFKSDESDSGLQLFSDRSGLTKTDEQLALRDSTGAIEDVIVWANMNGDWSRGEDTDIEEIAAQGAWYSLDEAGAISSADLGREVVFARRFTQGSWVDTNAAADWFTTPFVTVGAPSGLPPRTADSVELLFTRVETKNPAGDTIEIACPSCETPVDVTGFFIKLGRTVVHEFSPETTISNAEPLRIKPLRLTGMDGMLSLKDFQNETEDFVCWTDRTAPLGSEFDFDLTIAEVTQLEKRARNGEWMSDDPMSCLDSRDLLRGGAFVRDGFIDSHAKEDWQIEAPSDELAELIAASSDALRLSELLPNPAGEDAGVEWFELHNTGTEPVDLYGWSVTVGSSGYLFEDSELLPTGAYRAFRGRLPIRNSGGEFQLFDPEGQLMDTVTYPSLEEDIAFAKSFSGWEAATISTPDAPNGFFAIMENDTDADGLSDALEIELGTNPAAFDTDGDQLPDRFELEISSDPTVYSSSPAQQQVYRAQLTQLAQTQLFAEANDAAGVVLAGRGVPGGVTRLFLQSELQIIDVPVAADGSWSYNLDTDLPAGTHHLFLQSIDPAGFTGVAERILEFNLSDDFTPPTFAEGVIISEVLPNPAGDDATGEFIEIHNAGTEVADLTGWQLRIASKEFTLPEIRLPPGVFYILKREESGLTLPNARGELQLRWPTGRVVSTLDWHNAKDDRAFTSLGETTQPTVGVENIIIAPVTRNKKAFVSYANGDLSDAIIISEVLPNPIGSDSKTEFIELWNSGGQPVNLGNWQLMEASGKVFLLPGSFILQAGEYRTLTRAETKLALNNAGNEFVALHDFRGNVISKVAFTDLPEGVSLALDGDMHRKTGTPTPAAANIFDTEQLMGRVRFIGTEYLILETELGEQSIHLSARGVGLLARAVLRDGDEVTVYITTDAFLADIDRTTLPVHRTISIAPPSQSYLPLVFVALLCAMVLCGLYWRGMWSTFFAKLGV